MASIAGSNVRQQLAAVQEDMRSNLTVYFAPVPIAVTFLVLQTSGRRRLSQEGEHKAPQILEDGSTKKILERGTRSSSTIVLRHGWSVTTLTDTGMNYYRNLFNEQEDLQYNPKMVRKYESMSAMSRNLLEAEKFLPEPGGRHLLQSSSVSLQVNVTFPSTSQNSASQGLASTLDQALQSNPSSILGGFEQGWGSVGVTSVALSYVTSADSGLVGQAPSPPSSPTSGSSDGSVGTFVGIAVAAVLGLTVLAGRLAALVYLQFIYLVQSHLEDSYQG